jgi:Cys-tRNA(Pro)/Cys-tRNA(Cys) deacylase
VKTNAVRALDDAGVAYELVEYDVDESDLSAAGVALKIGLPDEQVFKTLALRGDKTGVLIALAAAGCEIDLKAIAAASGNKHCEMLPLKEVQPVTGYIRGGVSPIGMKKRYPVYIDETVILYDRISVSAGQRGLQMLLAPDDLIRLTDATLGDIQRAA